MFIRAKSIGLRIVAISAVMSASILGLAACGEKDVILPGERSEILDLIALPATDDTARDKDSRSPGGNQVKSGSCAALTCRLPGQLVHTSYVHTYVCT